MNAVPIRQDAADEEKEEATKKAEEQWEKMGRTASWGCTWYKRWFDLVCTAVEKKQQLKAVFFPGQARWEQCNAAYVTPNRPYTHPVAACAAQDESLTPQQ